MIDKVIDSLLANKLADLTQYLVDRGYNENPGLARALRKLADTIDIPDDVVDVEYSEAPKSWSMGDVE
jgi:hypothetical protein